MSQSNVPLSNIQEFIEREWQKRDEADIANENSYGNPMFNLGQFSESWYNKK